MGVGSHQRADPSHRVDLAGTILKEDAEGIGSGEPACKVPDGSQGIPPAVRVERIQHTGGHLAVCLGFQPSLQTELLGELAVIFYDAVVDQGDGAEAVGMGIGVGDAPVGGPAGMPDAAVGELPLVMGNHLAQGCNLPHGFYQTELGVLIKIGDPCAVVAAVLQACQAVQQNPSGLQGPGISDNSTHMIYLPFYF